MKADTHPREAERLSALAALDILDTDRDAEFDEIVALASALCDAPVSLITLIDRDRQWFKAAHGYDGAGTHRDIAICGHAILETGLTEIPDMLEDLRTLDNPLCTDGPKARFYAGAPLVDEAGLPMGTLCVLDFEPRQLTPLQKRSLTVLARQVMKQMQLRQALSHADLLRREVDHRVKNSLQTLATLTRMQAQVTGDATVQAALEEVDARISVIAEVHHAIYKSQHAKKVELDAFLSDLLALLARSGPGAVQFEVSLDPLVLDAAQAAPLALILNELVLNAFKHGFARGQSGDILVQGRCDAGAGLYALTVEDNGAGVQGDVAPDGDGLGSQIIQASVQQLGGVFEASTQQGGYRAALRFPTGAEQG